MVGLPEQSGHNTTRRLRTQDILCDILKRKNCKHQTFSLCFNLGMAPDQLMVSISSFPCLSSILPVRRLLHRRALLFHKQSRRLVNTCCPLVQFVYLKTIHWIHVVLTKRVCLQTIGLGTRVWFKGIRLIHADYA